MLFLAVEKLSLTVPVVPIRPKGPPLNALRAFEAAARLGGFAAAAEELCVTPGAVAQHIKALEEWTEALLFERRSQGVRLTPLGIEVAGEFEVAFDRLGIAVQTLRVRAMPQVVRIATLPSVAQLWLSPRLPKIRAAAPDLTISVTVLERAPNLHREPFDLCLFYDTQTAGDRATTLHEEEIFPVCSPELVAKLKSLSDLKEVSCLHDVHWSDDWDHWIAAAVPTEPFKVRGPSFSLYSLAVEEAIHGAGILVGHSPLIDAHFETGALVAPFTKRVRTGRKLTLVSTEAFVENSSYKTISNILRAR